MAASKVWTSSSHQLLLVKYCAKPFISETLLGSHTTQGERHHIIIPSHRNVPKFTQPGSVRIWVKMCLNLKLHTINCSANPLIAPAALTGGTCLTQCCVTRAWSCNVLHFHHSFYHPSSWSCYSNSLASAFAEIGEAFANQSRGSLIRD